MNKTYSKEDGKELLKQLEDFKNNENKINNNNNNNATTSITASNIPYFVSHKENIVNNKIRIIRSKNKLNNSVIGSKVSVKNSNGKKNYTLF